VILAGLHLTVSQKGVLRIVSKVNDSSKFLDAPRLASKNTIKKFGGEMIDAVSEDEERFPVTHRRRAFKLLNDTVFPIPGFVVGLTVVAP
jgi:hypothetical protein